MDLHELNNELPQLSPNIQTAEKIILPEGVNCELLFDSHHGVHNLRHIFDLAKKYGYAGEWIEGEDAENCEDAENWLNTNVCEGCAIEWQDDVWIVRDGYDFENGCEYDAE